MSVYSEARAVYRAIKDDATAVATIRSEYASLALERATSDKGGFDMTTATVAGQSFGGTRSMTKGQRLELLGLVVCQLDAGSAISSRGTVYGRTS